MKTLLAVCIGMLISLLPGFASATLGEPVNSATKNLSSSNISAKTTTEKYSIREYEQNGNTVREYASASGIVFAVGWNGISKPDLETLFGSYFNEYLESLNAVPKQYGAKTISMKTAKMVIRRGGRMRDQRGFAFVPSLVPEGVRIEDLQ